MPALNSIFIFWWVKIHLLKPDSFHWMFKQFINLGWGANAACILTKDVIWPFEIDIDFTEPITSDWFRRWPEKIGSIWFASKAFGLSPAHQNSSQIVPHSSGVMLVRDPIETAFLLLFAILKHFITQYTVIIIIHILLYYIYLD